MRPAAWVRYQAIRAADGSPAPLGAFHAPPPVSPPDRLARSAGTRFTEEQYRALSDHAKACGMPVTAFIRRVILGVNPVARRPETRSAIVAVNRVGNNLNQLVHLAHTGVVLQPDLLRAVREVLAAVHALRSALLRADAGEGPEPLG